MTTGPRPQVSVLMPLAPRAPFLHRTLEALVGQTFDDWELVVALDGECAENRAALQSVPASRLVVVALDAGSGIATALNAGLSRCRGPLVARLDGDDVCHPERLERQVAFLADRPDLVLVGCGAREVDEATVPTGMRAVRSDNDLRRSLIVRNRLIHPSVMMRREAVLTVGGYNPECRTVEDYELWLRLGAAGRIANMPDTLLDYRLSSGQHSRTFALGPQLSHLRRARRLCARAVGVPGYVADAAHVAWMCAHLPAVRKARTRGKQLAARLGA